MANDLERFLQQAAERLAQKAGNRGAAPPRPSRRCQVRRDKTPCHRRWPK